MFLMDFFNSVKEINRLLSKGMPNICFKLILRKSDVLKTLALKV